MHSFPRYWERRFRNCPRHECHGIPSKCQKARGLVRMADELVLACAWHPADHLKLLNARCDKKTAASFVGHNSQTRSGFSDSHLRNCGCYQHAAPETRYSLIFFQKNALRFCDTNHIAFCIAKWAAAWCTMLANFHGGVMLTRRDILIGTGLAGVAALARPITSVFASAAQPKTPVNFKVPAHACDCHTHIFGDPAEIPVRHAARLHA